MEVEHKDFFFIPPFLLFIYPVIISFNVPNEKAYFTETGGSTDRHVSYLAFKAF